MIMSTFSSTPASAENNECTSKRPPPVVIHWFRKGLRLHDNPALMRALSLANGKADTDTATTNDNSVRRGRNASSSGKIGKIYPIYIVDPNSYQLLQCSVMRAKFLLECIQDLDSSLRTASDGRSRLYVTKGDPVELLPQLWKRWNVTHMTMDADETGEPYAAKRDVKIRKLCEEFDVTMEEFGQETLRPLGDAEGGYVRNLGGRVNMAPNTMGGFQSLFGRIDKGKVALPLEPPTKKDFTNNNDGDGGDDDEDDGEFLPLRHPCDIPWPRGYSKEDIGPVWNRKDCEDASLKPIAIGGETRALERLKKSVSERPDWTASFQKPQTSCTSPHEPSTTALSPYLSLGCLSPRTVWHAISRSIQKSNPKTFHSKPPVSLHGQLLWRDFNYLMAHCANKQHPGSWGTIDNNPYCRNIHWSHDLKLLNAWKEARTGYPWIDACLTQLHTQGWIHHLGRHAVACFLTRGDLWQSWTEGAKHFEGHLLDADYAINNFNWMWLSCSGFFYQYFRCYSPIAFQKKNDPNGEYIKKFLPLLGKLPAKYIYEPWKAPREVQERCGVIIGRDYPRPIVDHAVVSKENMGKMSLAYDMYKDGNKGSGKHSSGKGGDGKKAAEGKSMGGTVKGASSRKNANEDDGPPKKKAKKQMKLK